MSTQISIDDIAFEYQLDAPLPTKTVVPVLVGNDLICDINVCVAANTYTMLANPDDVPTVKAYLNAKAKASLPFLENNQFLTNMTPMICPGNTGSPFSPQNAKWSTINVAGMVGNITKVSLRIFGLTTTDPVSPGRVLLVLQSPLGFAPHGSRAGIQLMYGNGGLGAARDVSNITVYFDDSALGIIPPNGPLVGATYQVSGTNPNFVKVDQPTGGPLAPLLVYGIAFSPFNGVSPNGTWTLWGEAKVNAGSQFSITGWGLNITTA